MSVFTAIEPALIEAAPTTHEILRQGNKLAVHTENFVQVWLCFEEDGLDLRLYECHDEVVGKVEWPDGWFTYELGENGYDSWFDFPSVWGEERSPGIFLNQHARWAMEHGIAPGQAFCVRLRKPTIYRYADGDTDAEFDGPEILEVERMTPLEVQRAWEHHLMESWRERDELEWQHRVVLERRRTDSNALFVMVVRDPPDGRPSTVVLRDPPPGYAAHLYSKHASYHDETHGQALLGTGRGATTLRAFAQMLKQVHTTYPALLLRKIVTLYGEHTNPHWRLCRAHCGDRFKTHNRTQQFCDKCRGLIDIGRRLTGDVLDLFEGEPARVFVERFRVNRTEFESAWRLGANDDDLRRILFAPLSLKGMHWKLMQAMKHERDSLVELQKQGVF